MKILRKIKIQTADFWLQFLFSFCDYVITNAFWKVTIKILDFLVEEPESHVVIFLLGFLLFLPSSPLQEQRRHLRKAWKPASCGLRRGLPRRIFRRVGQRRP